MWQQLRTALRSGMATQMKTKHMTAEQGRRIQLGTEGGRLMARWVP